MASNTAVILLAPPRRCYFTSLGFGHHPPDFHPEFPNAMAFHPER